MSIYIIVSREEMFSFHVALHEEDIPAQDVLMFAFFNRNPNGDMIVNGVEYPYDGDEYVRSLLKANNLEKFIFFVQ